MFEHFFMQKCSDGDEHYFSEHFFQSWNEITNTQKIIGWYKVYIQGISEPNKKQKKESGKVWLKVQFFSSFGNTLATRGLEDLFFWLCCCVSFLVSGGK
jgi:hypothetical protein